MGKKRKQCSKNRWQGFERFMAFAIGGKRVLGQAAKYTGRQDTFGDAQSESVVCECKARDPAPKKWRENNPQVPYDKIKIETIWLTQIVTEARAIDKWPFLAYNIKYTGLSETYVIYPIKPTNGKFDNLVEVDSEAKQFTFSTNIVPTFIKIGDSIFMCEKLKSVIYFLYLKDLVKYKSIDELLKAWKEKNKDAKTS